MTQYIDKSAVVAEIERRIKKYATIDVGNSSELDALYGAKCKALMEILSFLDTLEVKEVDLEKEFDKYCENLYVIDIQEAPFTEMYDCAKHFFELGLKFKSKRE